MIREGPKAFPASQTPSDDWNYLRLNGEDQRQDILLPAQHIQILAFPVSPISPIVAAGLKKPAVFFRFLPAILLKIFLFSRRIAEHFGLGEAEAG